MPSPEPQLCADFCIPCLEIFSIVGYLMNCHCLPCFRIAMAHIDLGKIAAHGHHQRDTLCHLAKLCRIVFSAEHGWWGCLRKWESDTSDPCWEPLWTLFYIRNEYFFKAQPPADEARAFPENILPGQGCRLVTVVVLLFMLLLLRPPPPLFWLLLAEPILWRKQQFIFLILLHPVKGALQ